MEKTRRRFVWLLLIVWASIWMDRCPSFAGELVRVEKVFDGDTIQLENGLHIRYIGINAPEIPHPDKPGEPFGKEALVLNEKFVLGKMVRLEWDQERVDPYGRRLAYVFLKDGTFVNRELVQNGLAFVLYSPPNVSHASVLLQSQREAMTAGKGVWEKWKEEPAEYIGNKKTRRFHLKSCAFGNRISKNNRTLFNRKWDAFREGYSPCRKCLGQGAE